MKPATIKYILFMYLYRVIDDKYVFEYDWTNDRWWFCKSSTLLNIMLSGEELLEEEAVIKAEEFRSKLAEEPYTRKYALSPYFQI
jgi:hypothetical protein